jgi:hypothetical protein
VCLESEYFPEISRLSSVVSLARSWSISAFALSNTLSERTPFSTAAIR